MDRFQEMVKTKLVEEQRLSCERGKQIWLTKISPLIEQNKITAVNSNQLELLPWTTFYSLSMTDRDYNDLKYFLDREMPANYRLETERPWIRKCLRLIYYS